MDNMTIYLRNLQRSKKFFQRIWYRQIRFYYGGQHASPRVDFIRRPRTPFIMEIITRLLITALGRLLAHVGCLVAGLGRFP